MKRVRAGFPDKRTATALSQAWADNEGFEAICNYMRADPVQRGTRLYTSTVIDALKAVMKHTAQIVPATPLELGGKAVDVIWRGEKNRPVPQVGSTVALKCFASFSYDQGIALNFAGRDKYPLPPARSNLLYRLQVDRIARGTPWLWFTYDSDDQALPPRWKNSIAVILNDEKEVLMPPGFLKVLTVRRHPKFGNTAVVDVAFVPQAEYLRRGVLPRLNTAGRVIAKTVGGHPLITNNSAAATDVRARRDRLVSRAAGALRPRQPPPGASNARLKTFQDVARIISKVYTLDREARLFEPLQLADYRRAVAHIPGARVVFDSLSPSGLVVTIKGFPGMKFTADGRYGAISFGGKTLQTVVFT